MKTFGKLTKTQLHTLLMECEDRYDNLRAERDALQVRLKLAEGLAEALEGVYSDLIRYVGSSYVDVFARDALAAWRDES